MSPTLAAEVTERDRSPGRYQRHRPEQTLLYQIVEQHYPQFVDLMARQGGPLPDYMQREFEDYLRCGRSEHGFIPYILPYTPSGPAFGCSNTFPTYLSAGTLRHLPRRASDRVQLQTPWVTPGFRRFAILLRLKVQGTPSVACPFGGAKIHRIFAISRLTLPCALRASFQLFKIAPGHFVEPLDFISPHCCWPGGRGRRHCGLAAGIGEESGAPAPEMTEKDPP